MEGGATRMNLADSKWVKEDRNKRTHRRCHHESSKTGKTNLRQNKKLRK